MTDKEVMLLELRFAASNMINNLHTIITVNPFTIEQKHLLHQFIDDRHHELTDVLTNDAALVTADTFNELVAEVGELVKLYIDTVVK